MGCSDNKLGMIKVFKCRSVGITGLAHPVRKMLALTYLNPTQAKQTRPMKRKLGLLRN